ncbi:MAG: hypothetical protein HY332_09940 [Chloroflexi bacterium]|nr:hypothetical protein [Chloroflexota bacterium]
MPATTARAALFERLGLQVGADEFEGLVDEALRSFLPERAPRAARSDLSDREAGALQEVGLSFERRATGPDSPLARTAAEFAALLASALTVRQAAARLGVEPSRVRQRLAEHTLYGIKLKTGWRLPLFQFAGRGTVPNVEVVAPRLFSLHPVVVVHGAPGRRSMHSARGPGIGELIHPHLHTPHSSKSAALSPEGRRFCLSAAGPRCHSDLQAGQRRASAASAECCAERAPVVGDCTTGRARPIGTFLRAGERQSAIRVRIHFLPRPAERT